MYNNNNNVTVLMLKQNNCMQEEEVCRAPRMLSFIRLISDSSSSSLHVRWIILCVSPNSYQTQQCHRLTAR